MNQDRQLMREPGYGTLQHYMTIPLYAMIKFGMWENILKEAAPDSDLLYPNGVWHFSRGMAYTRTNQLNKAMQELAKLKVIAADSSLMKVTIWDINTTYDLLQIATAMLNGELAASKRDFASAIQHLQRAVALEDNLTYDEPPPWYTPARHNLGAVLLEAGRPAEAQKVYEDDLKKYPENGWSLFGLQQSLLAQNKTAEAEAVKRRLDQAWAGADVTLVASRF
jgi:tetratricopeptide (TPR) repeat protein